MEHRLVNRTPLDHVSGQGGAMSRTTSPRSDGTAGRPKLKRSMGLWMATALVVGNMIGSGVFLLPASLAGTAGPVSVLAWIFTGAGAILLALVFAGLGRSMPRTGGPYAYARRAFGDFVGFQTAWGLLDRGLGRQRRHRRGVRRLRGGLLVR